MASVADGIRAGILLPLLLVPAAGQEITRVPYQCSQEEVATFGLHCTEDEPCPVYLELAAVEQVGVRLFVVGNLHTESVTLQSVLLASPDGGRTWSEPYERIPGAALDRVQFFDYATGWISGQIVQPLPRDPFFLLTTDGGTTWRRRPVFSESRTGAVERFWFNTRDDGTLWIDRSQSGDKGAAYERYETATGGESWTLREAAGKLPAPGPADKGRDVGWRIRPDTATRAYRLERRGENQWQLVAAFPIPIGMCAPPAGELTEPPEPPPPPEEKKAPPRKKR
ncbi:MAG: WD40/YVTN/BNR-like repeat-containing protein [Bryobacteraceae bacterium]